MKYYSHPTEPGSRSLKYKPVFGRAAGLYSALGDSMRQTKCHELFWYPDTYDVARGLVLGGHSSSSSSALVE